MGAPWYATRETVKVALDVLETARADARIDAALRYGTEAVDKCVKRTIPGWSAFSPLVATRTYDWPDFRMGTAYRLWTDRYPILSITTMLSGGVAVTSGQRKLYPAEGPPYDRIEVDLSGSATLGGGGTHQQDVSITGVYCAGPDDSRPAGATAEALDDSETAIDVTDSASIGVGDLIKVDSERMIVTGKAMLTTGQTLQANLASSREADAVSVTTGSAFTVGETILLDTERMLIVDIAGNTLTVKRQWDGTRLAAHAGSTIYAPRTLTVERGAGGTTAASHLTAAAVTRHVPPALAGELCLAEALTDLLQSQSAWARVVGSGDNQREASGRGINDIRSQCYAALGRKGRTAAI